MYILDHKASLSNFRRIEIILNFFPDHSGSKLENNYIKKHGKMTNKWMLNSMLLNNYWVEEDIKREIKKKKTPWEKWEWKCDIPDFTLCNKSSAEREVYRNYRPVSRIEKEESQVNNWILHLKELEKKEQIKP